MKRYIKLSLLLLLLIPLFIKNVYAEEIKDTNIPLTDTKEELLKTQEGNLEVAATTEKDFQKEQDTLKEESEVQKDTEGSEKTITDKSDSEIQKDLINSEELSTDKKEETEDVPKEDKEDKTGTSLDTEKEPVVSQDAEEKTEMSDNTEDSKKVTIEDILEVIGKEYILESKEIDNVTYTESSTKVKDELKEKINNNLLEKNYNLESLGYKYEIVWNYLENKDKSSYTIIILDKDDKELTREELKVKYSNEAEYKEENLSLINKFLEDKELKNLKEYTLDEALSLNKEGTALIPDLKEYLNIIFKDSTINYFITENNKEIILSIDGIIYKTITVESDFLIKIHVPSEEKELDYINNYLNETLKKYEHLENIRYDNMTGQIFVTINEKEILLGKVSINKVVKEYNFKEGSNSKITQDGTLKISIDESKKELKRVEINSVELNPKYYTTSTDKTVINIKNEFIKYLNLGTYKIEVIFKSGRASSTFTIIEKQPTNTGNNNPPVKPSYTPTYTPNYKPSINTGNYYRPTNNYNYNSNNNIEDNNVENDLDENTEEKEKEEPEIEDNDIQLDDILEEDKDNDDDKKTDSKDSEEEKENSLLTTILKSRYVPIIIVVVAILIGGITAYLYLKAKEESI